MVRVVSDITFATFSLKDLASLFNIQDLPLPNFLSTGFPFLSYFMLPFLSVSNWLVSIFFVVTISITAPPSADKPPRIKALAAVLKSKCAILPKFSLIVPIKLLIIKPEYSCNTSSVPSCKNSIAILLATVLPEVFGVYPNTNLSTEVAPNIPFKPFITRYSVAARPAEFSIA